MRPRGDVARLAAGSASVLMLAALPATCSRVATHAGAQPAAATAQPTSPADRPRLENGCAFLHGDVYCDRMSAAEIAKAPGVGTRVGAFVYRNMCMAGDPACACMC